MRQPARKHGFFFMGNIFRALPRKPGGRLFVDRILAP
jgi:hypothetical protein